MLATKRAMTQNPQPQPQLWPQSRPLPKQPVNMPHHSPQSSISSNSIFDTASMQSSQTSIDTPHAVMRDTCSDSIRTPRSSSLVRQAAQNQFDQYERKVWLHLAYNRPLLTTPTVVLIWAHSYRGLSGSTCGSRLQWGFMQWPPSTSICMGHAIEQRLVAWAACPMVHHTRRAHGHQINHFNAQLQSWCLCQPLQCRPWK